VICIFCLRADQPHSEEHIIPQGLVGTEDVVASNGTDSETVRFTLANGEVCRDCNSRMSEIDRSLQDAVGILRVYWNHVGTKKGTPATATRPGLLATRRPGGPHIILNEESHAVTTESGTVIPPADGRRNALEGVRINFGSDGKPRDATFIQPITLTKKVIRAMHKIAFETMCFQRGAAKVLDSRYDALRRYILRGNGSRSVGVPRDLSSISADTVMRRPVVGLQRLVNTLDFIAELRMGITFRIDLTPDQSVVWPSAFFKAADKQQLKLRLHSQLLIQDAVSSAPPRTTDR